MSNVTHGCKRLESFFWGGRWHKHELSFCGLSYALGDWPHVTTHNHDEVTCKRCLASIKKEFGV